MRHPLQRQRARLESIWRSLIANNGEHYSELQRQCGRGRIWRREVRSNFRLDDSAKRLAELFDFGSSRSERHGIDGAVKFSGYERAYGSDTGDRIRDRDVGDSVLG